LSFRSTVRLFKRVPRTIVYLRSNPW